MKGGVGEGVQRPETMASLLEAAVGTVASSIHRGKGWSRLVLRVLECSCAQSADPTEGLPDSIAYFLS